MKLHVSALRKYARISSRGHGLFGDFSMHRQGKRRQ
jgi:hypothetical protein